MIEAYADGVNLYAAEHPEATLPGLTPVTGADVVAGFAFRTPFFYGFGRTLETLFTSTERPGTTAPGPTGALYPGMDGFNIGSNAAALSPRRTAEGATWLLVNSHQPWVGPVSWYEARIHSDEGWDMTGGVFPGSPFILHGVGPHLGWANTVNLVDLVDVYLLTVNPDNPNQYLFDGEWRDFTRGEARMTVKIWGRSPGSSRARRCAPCKGRCCNCRTAPMRSAMPAWMRSARWFSTTATTRRTTSPHSRRR